MKGLILKDLINLKGLLKFQGITILVFALMFILMGNSFFFRYDYFDVCNDGDYHHQL